MSSDHQSGDPSPAASPGPEPALSLVEFLRTRGAPLLDGLDAHFPGAREQANGAAAFAFATAVEIGLIRSSAEVVREAARLHGVGRVYVPAEVLAKPEPSRTVEETAMVAAHHEQGAQLARGAGIPDRVCEWIRLGAERYDGGGPDGLAGEAIPLQVRISQAAHSYCDSMAAGASDPDAAHGVAGPAAALSGGAGRELDPMVVAALEAALSRAQPV